MRADRPVASGARALGAQLRVARSRRATYCVSVDSHEWFGILLTLMYAVVLPVLVITAGVWAAQLGGEGRSGITQRSAGEARDAESR